MSLETRDHYIERLRKRTGYVERASFRMSAKNAEVKPKCKLRVVWLIFFLTVAIVVTVALEMIFREFI